MNLAGYNRKWGVTDQAYFLAFWIITCRPGQACNDASCCPGVSHLSQGVKD